MERLATTPFGRRPVTAGLIASERAARETGPLPRTAKWPLLRQLCTARKVFGLSDRALGVLSALVSFLPGDDLDPDQGLVVFPSNAALSARTHGMAESTLRRHLAGLVTAGFLRRRDSPNGKRYAARNAGGAVVRAFGFDLGPLLERMSEIGAAAERATAEKETLTRLREAVMCLKRDAIKLLDYAGETRPGPHWDGLRDRLALMHRCSRRKLGVEEWQNLRASLEELVDILERELLADASETANSDGSDSQNERHCQSSDKDVLESESAHAEPARPDGRERLRPRHAAPLPPALSLDLIRNACPDICLFAEKKLGNWHDLVAAASRVHAMMGITRDTWTEAMRIMGPENAAVTLAAMLQRFNAIKSPGAYLRALSARARNGGFTPRPMVLALLRAAPC